MNSIELLWHSFLFVEVVSEGATSGQSEYMKQVLWLLSNVYQLHSSFKLHAKSHMDNVMSSCTSIGSELHCPLIRHSFTPRDRCESPMKSKKLLKLIMIVPCDVRYNFRMKQNVKITSRCHLSNCWHWVYFDIFISLGTACTIHIFWPSLYWQFFTQNDPY